MLKWEKLGKICAAEALDLPCHGSGIPDLQLFLGSANSFQPAAAGIGNLESYPHFSHSKRCRKPGSWERGSWRQGDAPGLYLRLKETSQEWDHGAGGGSIGQLSEDLLPKEGQVPQQRALTEHSQLSGSQPGSHWGSPVLGQDRTLLLP